jgi:hypothetical protein
MQTVTFKAARRRFSRHHGHCHLSKLKPREVCGMNGAKYALMEGNTIRDAGGVNTVERWCREAGALAEAETVVE